MTYLVQAFRWGWTNNHHYLVYAGPDREKAIRLASAECAGRGGKYGVQVTEVTCNGEEIDHLEHIAYYSSLHGEKQPHTNWRIEWFESVGNVLCTHWEDGIGQPDEHIPVWIQQLIMQRRDEYKALYGKEG